MKTQSVSMFNTVNVVISVGVALLLFDHLILEHEESPFVFYTIIFIALLIPIFTYFFEKRRSRIYLDELKAHDESNFAIITDSLVNLISIQDVGAIQPYFYNSRWVEYAGSMPSGSEEFWDDIIQADDRAATNAAYFGGLSGTSPFDFEYRIRRHDGMYRWHAGKGMPFKNKDGEVTKWVISSTDIHDQKTAEEERSKLIRQLEEKTQVIEAVLEHMPSGVIMADANRNIILKNKQLVKFFNMDDSFKVGSLKAFHPEDNRPFELQELPLPSAIRTGVRQQKEIVVPDQDGKYRLFNFNSSPVFASDGKIIGAVSIIDEITQKREDERTRAQRLADEQRMAATEKSNELLETLIDNIPHMILMKDADTLKYVKVNKAACETLKMTSEELMGKTPYDLHPLDQAKVLAQADIDAINSNKLVTIPYHEVTVKNGGTRVYSIRKFVLRQADGRRTLVSIGSDLTDVYRARDQAELLAKMKSEFLATMSHEIRTPLNGVLGMTDLVLTGELNEQQTNYMKIIQDSGKTLMTVVDDILDFSKAEAGQIRIEEVNFNLRKSLESHIELMKMRAQAKDLSFHFSLDDRIPDFLTGDPNRIFQVLNNLIGNAIKFTATGGIEVKIDLKEEKEKKATIQFSIRDTGIGISSEEQSHLFKPFTQADGSMARKYGGTGLGLSICKQLIDLMQGTIRMESVKNQGSVFIFDIQFEIPKQPKIEIVCIYDTEPKAPTATPVASVVTKPVNTEKKHILIAEDNKNNQILAEALLKALGYVTHTVANGQLALEASQKFDYDLILMDCQMPELDGYEATQKIREAETITRKRTPIVALTANALPQDREKCLAVGMDDFVAKPLRRSLLEGVLRTWLKTA